MGKELYGMNVAREESGGKTRLREKYDALSFKRKEEGAGG